MHASDYDLCCGAICFLNLIEPNLSHGQFYMGYAPVLVRQELEIVAVYQYIRVLAGAAGFEPAHAGTKSRCLIH